MTIDIHISEFAGLPVVEYSIDDEIADPRSCSYRLGLNWESFDEGETFADLFAAFVSQPSSVDVRAIVIGDWGGAGQGEGSAPVVEALVNARDRLPNLRALFLGEMIVEESEISWITQSDVSPLFEGFPQLEELWLRGGNGLSLGRPRHANLRKLVIETGGLPASVIREIVSAELPKLEHLELWLGDVGYGNDITDDDLKALLTSNRFPLLKHLGLRDDYNADQTAQLLAEVGPPTSVESLDLSLGTLGDSGAQSLAECGWIKSLRKLDIHHHYVSVESVARLKQLVPQVDDSDRKEPDDWGGEKHRYVAVAE